MPARNKSLNFRHFVLNKNQPLMQDGVGINGSAFLIVAGPMSGSEVPEPIDVEIGTLKPSEKIRKFVLAASLLDFLRNHVIDFELIDDGFAANNAFPLMNSNNFRR